MSVMARRGGRLGDRSALRWAAHLAVAAVLAWSGCSFGTSVIRGSSHVRGGHIIGDVLIGAAAGLGCGLAAIAWRSPDSYAPITDDASSWASPKDRADTIAAGEKWTPLACATTVVFFASAIYGNAVKPDDTANTPTTYEPPSYSAQDPGSSNYVPAQAEPDEGSDSQTQLCENGNQFACRDLADLYSTGSSMMSSSSRRIDWRRAALYFDKACEARDEESCLILGREYRDGVHVKVDQRRAFDLFKKACTGMTEKGCNDMRALSGSVGRLKYTGDRPELSWYCGLSWCHSDPVTCEAKGERCRSQSTSFCYVVQKGQSIFSACAVTQSTCEAGLQASVDKGLSKVSDCFERAPTVPGQVPGEGWYCSDGFGSAECTRLLGQCNPGYNSQCSLQKSSACMIAFDVLKEEYVSKCYPTLEGCKRDTFSMQMKADYSERSACFVAR